MSEYGSAGRDNLISVFMFAVTTKTIGGRKYNMYFAGYDFTAHLVHVLDTSQPALSSSRSLTVRRGMTVLFVVLKLGVC